MAASPPRFNDDAARAVSPSRSNTRAASLAWRVASPYFPRPVSTPASPIKARARSADMGRDASSARLYDSSAPFALPARSSLRASPSAASPSVWSDVIADRLQPASSRATQASSVFAPERAVSRDFLMMIRTYPRLESARLVNEVSPHYTCSATLRSAVSVTTRNDAGQAKRSRGWPRLPTQGKTSEDAKYECEQRDDRAERHGAGRRRRRTPGSRCRRSGPAAPAGAPDARGRGSGTSDYVSGSSLRGQDGVDGLLPPVHTASRCGWLLPPVHTARRCGRCLPPSTPQCCEGSPSCQNAPSQTKISHYA